MGREFAETLKITRPTPLNYNKVEVTVSDGHVKDGGVFFSNYILYTVSVSPLNYEVQRKDADFYTLRKIILRQFPHMVVPPLPPKSSKTTTKHIKKRERYYTRFLQALFRHEVFKSSAYLVIFLEEKDQKVL